MGPLRLRRADSAPGGPDEYFARLPESAIGDADLSDAALRLLAAIHLDMARSRTPKLSMATNEELGWLCGKKPRTVTRLIAELVDRGHLASEPVRTIAGCPRGLRPMARLRAARRRDAEGIGTPSSDLTRCTSPGVATHLATSDYVHSHDWPGTSPPPATPLKREGESQRQQQEGGSAADVVAPLPPDPQIPENPGRSAFLRGLAGDLAAALTLGASDGPGGIRQDDPGAALGSTLPDGIDSNTPPAHTSRSENRTKHNGR